MGYEVRLEVFEGPLDLLLHLITRRRVDIYDVSLATITEEFLAAVEDVERLDLETATSFLVVAATLLELKSARLLPRRGSDEGDGRLLEERDLLLARLVECATYREAGAYLRRELDKGGAYHPRAVAIEPAYLDVLPDLLGRVTVREVAALAGRLLQRGSRVELDLSHVAPIGASVKDAILEVAGALRPGRPVSFEQLCGMAGSRIEVVVRFLALLELYKTGAVELEQHERFGDIVAMWTGDVDARMVAEEAEEYSVHAEGAP